METEVKTHLFAGVEWYTRVDGSGGRVKVGDSGLNFRYTPDDLLAMAEALMDLRQRVLAKMEKVA